MFLHFLLISALSVFLYMSTLFIVASLKKDNSIVDIAWGLGFILIVFILIFFSEQVTLRQFLLFILVFIWGMRLAVHIFLKNKGQAEDFRYAAWRKQWGKNWRWRSFLQVFMLQGFFMIIIALPIIAVAASTTVVAINGFDCLGVGVWLFGFFWEAVGDYQLLRFKKNKANKGQFITHGLWQYSRHPNYFGECVMWWGIFIIALSSDFVLVSLVSPVIITWLLTSVSGVPMLEEKYKDNPAYQNYAAHTSAFIPWWKKQ